MPGSSPPAFEPGAETAALFEPADELLHHAAPSVQPAIEAMPPVTGVLVPAAGNHGLDRVPAQPVANPLEAVTLVAGERSRSGAATDADPTHDFLELCAFVDLPRRDMRREGKAVAVSDQVELAPESAARATQCVVDGLFSAPFFPPPAAEREARTIVPSTHHKSQSIWPFASSRSCRASRIRTNTPRRRQELKW